MSGLDLSLRPPPLDLGATHVRLWLGKLPRDYRSAFGEDVPQSDEEALAGLSEQLGASSTRGYAEIVMRHAPVIAAMGRPRRVRLLSWLTQMCWPDADKILRALSDVAAGESGGSAGGRAKVAPLFLSDIEVVAGVNRRRQVRAVASRRTVESVDVGLHEFADAFGPQSQGAI
jgi:hypothetical protein